MTFMVTSTGREHPLVGYAVHFDENAPRIEEIAHALAQINRFTGHAARPYSVAEHSLLVCDIVRGQGLGVHAQMAALLHDAHEAYVGDMATPIKHVVGSTWHTLEAEHEAMVHRAFCIRSAAGAFRAAVKRADLIALATERRDLMLRPEGARPWPVLDTPGAQVLPLEGTHLLSPTRAAMTWRHHRDALLHRYRALDAQRISAHHLAVQPLPADPATPV